ncbi:peptidylprolyl isomerase [Variovorax sp. J31P207]|uniref:peptidylprolyl isomerase n=1 Tax=Variovorax sp. J31P207 TaxID=3053510 RepID=UPI002578F924|nr:peptidylprolyl isomerase [Variovorax sp. J31P207]MDM0072270.1 peptidylprolyl isomerase [Variovorax sp. J31P207]
MKKLLHEPLLQFLLVGALLFGIYSHTRPAAAPSTEIRLSVDELGQLALVFKSQWRRDPTPEEFNRLVESKVQNEILYREGLAMGLDKDDEIVKRRMAQKMQFLAEDVAAAHEPTSDELMRWYDGNRERFAQPSRVSFRHLYFSPDRRGARAHDDAASALTQLAAQPEDTKVGVSLADPFMFQEYYRERAPEFLGKEFGPRFAQAVAKLPPDSWQGPIESGFGWHLVFVDAVLPGRVPAFEEIEQDVKTAWLTEQKAQAWQKAYKDMRAKYTILLPAATDIAQPARAATAPGGKGTPSAREEGS